MPSTFGNIKAFIFLFFILMPHTFYVAIAATLSMVFVKPFSPRSHHSFLAYLANQHWTLYPWYLARPGNARIAVYGEIPPVGENVVLLANHQSFADIFVTMVIGRRLGRLGNNKYFAKDTIKFYPGWGWAMWAVGCIFVKRNWNKDAKHIHETFSSLRSSGSPFWIILYPEGTRKRPKLIQQSQQFARERGLPIFQNCLVPRTKGFVATLSELRDVTDAVYDVTIAYENHRAPALWTLLAGEMNQDVTIHVRRFDIQSLPHGEEGLSRWLMERFEEKDRILASGVFEGERWNDEVVKQIYS